jgi:hypothetical protein
VSATAKFVVRRKLFLNPRQLSDDVVENRLLYHQAATAIHDGSLLCNIEDAEILAALRLQAEIGDFDETSEEKHANTMYVGRCAGSAMRVAH